MEISETEGDARETACDLRASVCTLYADGGRYRNGGWWVVIYGEAGETKRAREEM